MIGALIIVVAGSYYWFSRQSDDVFVELPVEQPTTAVPANVYKDDALGFSITLPTVLASTTNDTLYSVEAPYAYTAMGPDKSIAGVKFTIPRAMTAGTNLSSDSYISVEHLEEGEVCDASAFMSVPGVASRIIREGSDTYSFASSSDAGAGNRYEEYVYAFPDTNPCLAVRYFVHYGAIENYESDITAFNRTKLFADFDSIRKTLVIN